MSKEEAIGKPEDYPTRALYNAMSEIYEKGFNDGKTWTNNLRVCYNCGKVINIADCKVV